jgi:hypothetical protein
MKGIVHFVAGVATASCFPFAVEAGANGNPLYFILGGCCGLLPDTIDFKFSKFFYKHDIEIAPDPVNLNAELISDAIADAVNRVCETGKSISIKLDTVRLGADMWQRYEIRLDGLSRQVEVSFLDVVNTGMQFIRHCDIDERQAVSPVDCDLKSDYLAVTTVDILDGPVLHFEAYGDEVRVKFLPWHRAWSHSLIIALLIALSGTLIWGVRAGIIMFSALAAHTLVDQLGFMGCNLFYPFTQERTRGVGFARSTVALPNLVAVWTSILIVFWNLARAASVSYFIINPLWLFSVGLLLPLLALKLWKRGGVRE